MERYEGLEGRVRKDNGRRRGLVKKFDKGWCSKRRNLRTSENGRKIDEEGNREIKK